MLPELTGKSSLIVKSQIRGDVCDRSPGTSQLVAGGMDPHFYDILLRRSLEMLLKFSFKLPNRESGHFREHGYGNLPIEMGAQIFQGG